jgi:hypothetical protein
MLLNFLGDIKDLILGIIVSIPLNNMLSKIYVVLSFLINLLLTALGYSPPTDTTSGGLFDNLF